MSRRPLIPRASAIVSRRKLDAGLAALADGDRAGALAILREALDHAREEVGRRLDDGAPGRELVAGMSMAVDEVIRAHLLANLKPVGAARAGDHLGAHQLADLDRRQPDAPGGAKHHQPLAGLQFGAVIQRDMRRAIRDQKRRRGRAVHRIGHRHAGGRVGQRRLGEPAVADQRRDPLAELEMRDPFAQRLDRAADLGPRRERQGRLFLILAVDRQRVAEIDPAGLQLQAHLAGARLGRGNVVEAQAFAENVKAHGAHGRVPLWFVSCGGPKGARRVCAAV